MRKKSVDEKLLYKLYVIEEYSQRDIAKILSVSQSTIRRSMKKYNIKPRGNSESRNTSKYKEKELKNSERYKNEYTKIYNKICANCGGEFVVMRCDRKNKKYCSKKCELESRKKRRSVFCQKCGEEIKFDKRVYNKKYCDKCYEEVRKSGKSGRYNKVETECGYCHKKIFVTQKRFEKFKNVYCNRECMSKHYSEIYSGENSPTWKGDKSHHYTGNFYHQRKLARKRDGYRCALCGISEDEYGKEMSVHHIKNYRKFNNKEEANELNNLISLCENCHRFVHSNKNTDKIFIED